MATLTIANAQNNTFPSNGDVGIGTTLPHAKLDVVGDIYINGGAIQFKRTYENYGNVLTINTKDDNHYGDYRFVAEKTDVEDTKLLMFIDGDKGSVGIGTGNTFGYKLAVNGIIGTKEVKVETSSNWPDYVFCSEYELTSLDSIAAFIKQHHHLPKIPTAGTVEKEGIALGEMNRLLLEKIEEMTLYMIQQQKQLQNQQAKFLKEKKVNDSLRREMNTINNRLLQLEKALYRK